jgi:hypothetical protein
MDGQETLLLIIQRFLRSIRPFPRPIILNNFTINPHPLDDTKVVLGFEKRKFKRLFISYLAKKPENNRY